jgi:spermidine synthase
MSFAGLLLKPDPKRILIAGLGGGTIPLVLSELFPWASIDVIEIDESVARVAKEFFFFEETDLMRVHINDARVFIKRAALKEEKYDYIVLDAFSGDYIPEHMLTQEFLEEVKQVLTPDGVVVANTFSTSRFYDHESVTYQRVFGELYNFKLPTSGNRIILTQLEPLPDIGLLTERAVQLAPQLGKYGIPFLSYPGKLSSQVDWDMSRRVLTDQYSPSNLLRDN